MPFKNLYLIFDNIKINIIELLFSFYAQTKNMKVKDDEELKTIEKISQESGFIVTGNFSKSFANIPRIYYQHMHLVNIHDFSTKKELTKIPLLQLDMPIQYIGLLLDHSIEDLLKILLESDKYNLCLSENYNKNIEHIENLIIQKIKQNFTYKFTHMNSNDSFYDPMFIPNNYMIFIKRMFGSGKDYNKVKDETIRQQLVQMDTIRLPYPDQQQRNNNNNNLHDNYDFPLLFYVKKVFPVSKLNDPNFLLNLSNLNNISDSLNLINKKNLINKIVDIYCVSPETSDIVCFKKYRNYASPYAVSIAFNHQLVKEQNAAIFTNSEWKHHDLQLWTLDDLYDERMNNEQSCKELFLQQIYTYSFCQNNNIEFSNCLNNVNYSYTFKIPTNEEACYNFHKLFTKGLLDFSESQIKEFYSDNLVIGGSAFTFCACSHPYKSGKNASNEFLSYYNNSDVDCPILAGDNVFMTTSELEQVVDQKIKILQSYYPGGWKFEKKLVDKRFQITNNYNSTILELFSVPYSKATVWKHFAKYHFGWVRGYFDGFKWYILPSGVISVCTRLSIDIRYCATKHAPHELIYKYLKRGFAPIININEFTSLGKYIRQKYNDELYNYINLNRILIIPCFDNIYRDVINFPEFYCKQNKQVTEEIDYSIKNRI